MATAVAPCWAASRAVEGVGDLVETVLIQVAVDVHSHCSAAVAEHLLGDLDVRAASDCEAGGGVAESVRVETYDADRRGSGSKPPRRKIGWRRTPHTREHEVIGPHLRCWRPARRRGTAVPEPASARESWRAPNKPLALHESGGLGDRGSTPGEVEAPDPQRSHRTEPNLRVGACELARP